MSLYTRSLAALALAATVLALGACGNENSNGHSPAAPDRLSAEEYRARFAAVEQQIDEATRDLDRALEAPSVDQIGAGLTRFAVAQEQAGDSLVEFRPPAEAERANAQLVQGAQHLAEVLRATASMLSGTTDPKEALKLIDDSSLEKVGTEVDRALGKLTELGYTTSGQGH